MLAECFQCLDVPGRIAASAVCRHWRAVALEYPAVWSTLHILRAKISPFLLEEMLRRSRQLPDSLELMLTTAQDVALRGHMSHVHRLTCLNTPSEDLLSVPAPLLHSLATLCEDGTLTIPADFGAANLRSLRAGTTLLPSACPGLQNLQRLSAIFCRAHNLTQALALCPRLVELTVGCIDGLAKNAASVFQHPLPAPLSFLTIEGGALGPAEYSQSLRLWHGCRFERLALSRPQAIPGLLELFFNSHSLPWIMELRSAFADTTVTCRTTPAGDESPSTFIVIVSARPHPQSALRDCEGLLGRLAELTLSAHEFFKCMIDGLSLPMVTSITINVIPNFWSATMRWVPDYVIRGLEVPALQTLSFRPERRGLPLSKDILDWFFDVMPAHLREWLKYDASLLLRIALGGYTTPQGLSAVDSSRISELAVELSLPPNARPAH